MSIPTVPPPTYSQQSDPAHELHEGSSHLPAFSLAEAQLLITPSGSASQFQKGYLGASGERAAIEGELQIKGVPVDSWESLSISLSSNECTEEKQIELNAVDIELHSRSQSSGPTLSGSLTVASSIPFSIPLTSDTPQCLHIGRSSLSHTLTATLRTTDPSLPPLSRSVVVHTRRFTSHLVTCDVLPHTVHLSTPTTVNVQVPRTVYRMHEPIPVYVTVPPPDRSVVLDHGFTLRSVRAELIRTVKILNANESDPSSDETVPPFDDEEDDMDDSDSASSDGIPPSAEFLSAVAEKGSTSYTVSSSDVPEIAASSESPYDSIIARSGSSCRFHSSRPVKLRLVLHGRSSSASPSGSPPQLPESEYTYAENDSQCASISQTTLLHSVEFRIQVRITFLHVSSRTEQTYPLLIPIIVLPPAAPLPEVDSSVDSAYLKKHDRPPLKTVRREDTDVYHGDHDTNHAGPSALPHGAPPPFEDAPPPFFTVGEASSSSRLPTFYESEAEIIVPAGDHPAAAAPLPPPPSELNVVGEGVLFGFPASEQYDGYSNEMARSATPPPSLEMARGDANVTDLASLVNQPERAMDALHMVLEQREESSNCGELPPPPPPPLDDPSDPPPSIDTHFSSRDLDPPPSIMSTDFTSPGISRVVSNHGHSPPPNGQSTSEMNESPPNLDVSRRAADPDEGPTISPSHAPPPYLNPVALSDVEHVSGPPPYVDLVPSADRSH